MKFENLLKKVQNEEVAAAVAAMPAANSQGAMGSGEAVAQSLSDPKFGIYTLAKSYSKSPKKGGKMVKFFRKFKNEETMRQFLKDHPDWELLEEA